MQEIRIPVGEFDVGATLHGGRGETLLVLGHGAGGNRRTPLLLEVATAVAESGRRALLYDFRYAEIGRRAPDPRRVLESTTRAVGRFAREELRARIVVHGGKSMGGRIASQVAAQGMPTDALVFLGYPLHAPGKTEKLRDAHLASTSCPMLFLQGTRDALARWDLVETAVRKLGRQATLHRVEDGDHSFRVLKRSGRTAQEVEAELIRAILAWLEGVGL